MGPSVFCSQLLFLKIDLTSLLPGTVLAKLKWPQEAEMQLPFITWGHFVSL